MCKYIKRNKTTIVMNTHRKSHLLTLADELPESHIAATSYCSLINPCPLDYHHLSCNDQNPWSLSTCGILECLKKLSINVFVLARATTGMQFADCESLELLTCCCYSNSLNQVSGTNFAHLFYEAHQREITLVDVHVRSLLCVCVGGGKGGGVSLS